MSRAADEDTSRADQRGSNVHAQKGLRRGIVFTTVAFAILMMASSTTIVATALYSLQHDLGTTVNLAGWTLTAYAFGVVLMLPVSGKLSERHGNRTVFVASIAVFTAASLGCALAGGIHQLIVLRVLQAVGGAGIMPSATGIIVQHFGNARDRAVALFGAIFPVGAMVGPGFGGLILTYWDWRGIFYINLPLGLLVVWLALRFIPADTARPVRAKAGMDLAGAMLLGAGLLAAMLTVNQLAESSRGLVEFGAIAALGVAAVVLLGLFARHIQRAAEPFIPALFVYGKGFGAVNLVNTIYGGIATGVITLLPLYATNRYGIGVAAAGLLLLVEGIAGILATLLATAALRRGGYRLPLYTGSAVMALGVLLVALAPPGGIGPYPWLAAGAFVIGFGAGTISPASRNAGLQLVPERAPIMASLRTGCFQCGTILSVAVITAILAHAQNLGITHAWIQAAVAFGFVAALPLVAHIPDHKGAW